MFPIRVEPVVAGVIGGVADFALGTGLSAVGYLAGVSTARVGLGLLSFQVLQASWIENCVSPIVEEVLFRGCLQSSITRLVQVGPVTPSQASLISILVTACLFGLAHYLSSASALRVGVCVVSGVVLGLLKEQHGLLACTIAHMVSNILN